MRCLLVSVAFVSIWLSSPIAAQTALYKDMRDPSNRALAEQVFLHVAESLPGWALARVSADQLRAEGQYVPMSEIDPNKPLRSYPNALRIEVTLADSENAARSRIGLLISVSPDRKVERNGRTISQWGGWENLACSVGKVALHVTAPKGTDEALIQKALDAAIEAAGKLRL